MNLMTENNFVILVLYLFRKLGDQLENNCSSNASFLLHEFNKKRFKTF